LLDIVKSGELINQCENKKDVVKKFGEPIYVKDVSKDGKEMKAWLYRYATRYFNSEKVYLYFDLEGKLLESEHVPAREE